MSSTSRAANGSARSMMFLTRVLVRCIQQLGLIQRGSWPGPATPACLVAFLHPASPPAVHAGAIESGRVGSAPRKGGNVRGQQAQLARPVQGAGARVCVELQVGAREQVADGRIGNGHLLGEL